MISPSFQIKPMNEGDNLAMDYTCESDEDSPLVIDCSYENDEVEPSPVTNAIIKLTNTESDARVDNGNSATMLLGDNDPNNRKCTTNSEEHLNERVKSSSVIKTKPENDDEDHISISSDVEDHISISDDEEEMKATYLSEDEECLTKCDIKIEDNQLLVEDECSKSIDNEHSGVVNGFNENLSSEPGAEAASNDSQSFRCNICPYETSDETYFAVHKKTHRNKYKCINCFYVSSSAIKLLHHQKKRHMTLEELLYYCGDCSFSSLKRIELVKHRRTEHINRRPASEPKIKCPDCSFKCCKKAVYTKHRVKQHNDVFLKCNTCKRVFLDQDDFQEHSLTHTYKKTEKGSYECRVCDYHCENKSAIVYHDKRFHKKKSLVIEH